MEVPAPLRSFGANPVAAVQGAVRSEAKKFRKAVKRAASRLGVEKEARNVDGKTLYVSYSDDSNDGVNETAAKLLMLLMRNPVAVGDEIIRTWLGQSQGEWKADAATVWTDYVVDHPSLAKAVYSDNGRNAFEPISMTVIVGTLITLAPVVLPILLSMVQDFFKSAQAKDAAAAEAQIAKDKAAADEAKAKENQKTLMIVGGVGLLIIAGIGAVVYLKNKG